MRDVVLTLVFGWAVVQAFRHPWAGALLWTWFSVMNPHRLTYGFANGLPFAAVAAGVTVLSVIIHRDRVKLNVDAGVVMLLTFIVWCCITTALAIHPDRSTDDLIVTLKIQFMTLICLATLRERRTIELFVWVMALSIAFYGAKGGVFGIATGGGARVWGPGGSLLEGNNELGLAIVMTIPLLNFLRVVSTRRWLRTALMVTMLLCAVAALATQSRGAFLAISAMGLVLWWRSKNKLPGAIFMVTAGIALLAFMPASWEARMQTIGTYQSDGSALGRLNAWQTAFNVANDRFTGAGFLIEASDIFARYAPDPSMVLTAHSIYFQALGEQGWVGLAIFLSLGGISFWTASSLRKEARKRPETVWIYDLAGMIQVSMVGYAVGGAFLSLTYLDLPYNLMVILLASKHWLREERWKTDTVGAFGSSVPRAALDKTPPKLSAPAP